MVFIYAGTVTQAKDFVDKHDIHPKDFRIIYTANQIYGVNRNSDSCIVTVGNYYRLGSTNDIHEVAVRYDMRIVREEDFKPEKVRTIA